MKQQLVYWIALFITLSVVTLTAKSEDQHCMNGATKEIRVEIGGDNAHRVMTYIRDDPGYQMNLQCKWILKPANYENPRQMYIQVPVVDFDTNNVTEALCNVSNPQLDVLTVTLKRNKREMQTQKCGSRETTFTKMQTLTKDQPEYKCSNKSFKIKREIVNLWDPSYNLTLAFRSDDQQVRPDAKGVRVDVQVLDRDYCHRKMLYFEGSCYLITPEKLTPAEAFNISRNYLGNVFTVPENKDRTTKDFLRAFFQGNSDRQGEFPYESPLTLSGQWMWTGYFIDLTGPAPKKSEYALFMNPAKDCCDEKRQLNVTVNPWPTSESRCAVAVMWNNDSSSNFLCKPMSQPLRALIEFKQIPSTKGDTHPQLFRTCDTLPLPTPTTTTPTPTLPPITPAPESDSLKIIIILVVVLAFVIIGVVGAVLFYKCRKRGTPAADATEPSKEKVPLNPTYNSDAPAPSNKTDKEAGDVAPGNPKV